MPAPAPTLEQRVTRAVERWATSLATENPSGEDTLGELAISYRAISIASPKAGLAVVATALDHIYSHLPGIVCYWVEGGCGKGYEPHVFLPTGPAGQALVQAGIVEQTDDERFVALPSGSAHALLPAFLELARKRRAALIASGATSCRVQRKLDEWQPAPLAACEQPARPDDVAARDAYQLCEANSVLWGLWQPGVASVWHVRLDCGGKPGFAMISLDREPRVDPDGVMFVVVGQHAPSLLEYVETESPVAP